MGINRMSVIASDQHPIGNQYMPTDVDAATRDDPGLIPNIGSGSYVNKGTAYSLGTDKRRGARNGHVVSNRETYR
jgi:hypothetical protein